jgi:hypothetical protein
MSSSRQVSLAAWLLLPLAVLPCPTRAETPPAQVSCQPAQSALSVLGTSLAAGLGPSARGVNVVVVELKSDRELPAPSLLRERVRGAVVAALGSGNAARPEPGKSRLELSIEKSGGVLRVTAELRRPSGLWQRLRHSPPRSESHAFAEVALDAELRALIPPPPLVVAQALKLKAPERGIVALACGPLRRDGGQELALVSRSSVRVGQIAGRAFVERKRAAWSALSSVAPAPLREPIAAVEITPQGTLRVGLTDRRDGLELSPELGVLQRFEGLLPVPGGGCVARSELGVSSQVGPCQPGADPAPRTAPATLDAVTGSARGVLGRELSTQRLVGTLPASLPTTLRPGAELGLGDADTDGALELAYASDTLEPDKDRLTVVTFEGNKTLTRFELAAPAISAVAICSKREGPGMAPIVLASGDELWVLR